MEQIQLFLQSCRSEQTRHNYEIMFQKYVEFLGEENLFSGKIETKIIEFILALRKEGKSYSAICSYIDPVKAFYKINDVVLNVYKIQKFYPERVKVIKDRSYTHEEIGKLLEIADERMRVVVLLLASSGIRIGALPFIKLRNLEDNKLTVYENSNEEYFTFITPECRKSIDSYIDFRQRYHEKINPESWLIREQFDIRNPSPPRQVIHKTLQWNIRILAIKCGIRKTAPKHDVKVAHGFRKFFTTQCIHAKINPEIREMLLGHKIGLAGVYYRPTEADMLEEYQKAEDNLTIDPANRLRKQLETAKVEKSRLDRIEQKMNLMEKMFQK